MTSQSTRKRIGYRQRKLQRRAFTVYSKAKYLEQDIATLIGPGYPRSKAWALACEAADAAAKLELELEKRGIVP